LPVREFELVAQALENRFHTGSVKQESGANQMLWRWA